MERLSMYIGIGVLVVAGALLALGLVHDVKREDRALLEQRLAAVPKHAAAEETMDWPWAEWEQNITANAKLWSGLVPPPPPPAPPPPPPPQRPDMAAMLKDVYPTRRGVGNKVRIVTPQNPRGDYYSVGDAINGCTIERVEKTEVVFTLVWPAKNEVLTYSLPRQ